MTTHFSSNTATKTDIQTIKKTSSSRNEQERKKKKKDRLKKKINKKNSPLPPAKSWASGYSVFFIIIMLLFIFFLSLMSVFLFSKAGRARGILGVLFLYIVAPARPNCEVPGGHFTCILELRGRIVPFLFLFFHTSLKDVRIRLTTKTIQRPVLGLHSQQQHFLSGVVLF